MAEDDSVWQLLAVWVFVGGSLVTLGAWTADWLGFPAGGGVGPVETSLGAGTLFGTAVTAVGWIVGVRPSVRASLAYFLLEQLTALLAELVVRPVVGWPRPVTAVVAITVAGCVVFGGVGRRLATTARPFVRRLLRLPPREE